ncbi:MAG: hypothetical protein ABFD50_16005 [Smithella sp.]
MKRKDAFIQILHEVSGISKEQVENNMAGMLLGIPGSDEEMSDAEYENFLNSLRENKGCL